MGYHRAGFDVVGVDIAAQPRYPFEWLREDALEILRDGAFVSKFDAIHASPPCQHYCHLRRNRHPTHRHPDLVGSVREAIEGTRKIYVIENVPGSPLRFAALLCGSMFGLDVRRHRLFESNMLLFAPTCRHLEQTPRFRSLDRRQKTVACVVGVHGSLNYRGELAIRQRAMGIDWMRNRELTQAIPPAYTEFIGRQLLAALANKETP